uniref:NADH-ubiquinone oxidoreductase chain 4 n=1 Tax=Aneurus similis TaxID=1176472 RepID=A0A172DYR3_9HEMI|nr:NADH dehydrogenase subunit 4 [Aneurus similis]AFI54675.1 NADH dehydrogenase subunit 4 [Aneurus similis]
MMSLLVGLVFLIPISFFDCWWLVICLLMFVSVLFCALSPAFSFTSLYSLGFGVDLVSYCMVVLTLWVVMLMFMASYSVKVSMIKVNYFSFCCFLLLIFLVFCFLTTNLFCFYLFFECSIIPTLFLVFGWGYQVERLVAGYYLLFYTMFASLPLLLGICFLNHTFGTLFFSMIPSTGGVYLYLSMILAFLVSMPMSFFHFWLPKAHVEAPVSGSMILAGVLLKLGGYGLYRVFFFLGDFSLFYNLFFVSVSIFGMVIIALLCLSQVDIKSMIAYSSVSHMALVIGGIMTMSFFGLYGSLLMMIGHGLCSSGLFCLANIVYERSHSRSFYINKGLISVMPSLSFFWFFFCSNNMASPFSLNLFGEFMLINSLISWDFVSLSFIGLSSFLSCCCSIYLYSITQHGPLGLGLLNFSSGSVREFYLLVLHLIPLNFLFLKVDLFTFWV